MSIADNIRIKQDFDPEGENGGYKFKSGLEKEPAGGGFVESSVHGIPWVPVSSKKFVYKSGTLVGRDDDDRYVESADWATLHSKRKSSVIHRHLLDPRITDADGKVLQPPGIGDDVGAKSGLTATEKAQRQTGKVAGLAAGYRATPAGSDLIEGYMGGQAAIRALDEDAHAPLEVKVNTAWEDLQRYCKGDVHVADLMPKRITVEERKAWLEGRWQEEDQL